MTRILLNFCKTGVLSLTFLSIVLAGVSCKKSNGVENINSATSEELTMNVPEKTNAIALTVPPSVSSLYSTTLNPIVSDDFNGTSVDMNRWQYRTDGTSDWSTSSSNVYIAADGATKFVSIKGNYTEQKGSGITSKQLVKYGFYITKWRVAGYTNNTANGWHPAIWGAGCDFSSSGNGNCIPEVLNGGRRLEIDFVEGFQSGTSPYWNSHLLLWNQSAIYQNIILKGNTHQWPTVSSGWITFGLEYTPTYIKLWRYASGIWSILKTIPITSAGSSATNMNELYRTPLYWVLSNKRSAPNHISGNSWLHVDYFYLYDYIGAE